MFHVLVFVHIHMCDINMCGGGGCREKRRRSSRGVEDEVIYFRLKKVLRYLISSYSHILLKKRKTQ